MAMEWDRSGDGHLVLHESRCRRFRIAWSVGNPTWRLWKWHESDSVPYSYVDSFDKLADAKQAAEAITRQATNQKGGE